MRIGPAATTFLGVFALACTSPLAAEVRDDELAALDAAISDAYSTPYDQRDEAVQQLLRIGARAEAMLAHEGDDVAPELRIRLLSIIGQAYFGAAQHHDSELDSEADALDREWLVKTVDALEPVLAALGPMEGPAYDLRGAAGQLFDHAVYYDLPQLEQWSALRVQANRYMLARMGDDAFEKELLAASLYDHGWMTEDPALIAEADALFDSFPEDDQPYVLRVKRRAIAAGEAPY